MKEMNALMLAAAVVLSCREASADVNYDSLYTAETGYVTLDEDDYGSVSSFAAAGNWSDGKVPHSGTNYYVGAGKDLFVRPTGGSLEDYVFPGDKLVVRGRIDHSSSGGNAINWGRTEFLPGSIYLLKSKGAIASGKFEVKGTADSPFLFNISSSYEMAFTLSMDVSSEDSSACMEVHKVANNTAFQKFFLNGDWSGFYGTLTCAPNDMMQTLLAPGFNTPGTIAVPAKGSLALQMKECVPVIGSLDVACGGKLCFANESEQSTWHVTNRLTLAAGAIVDCSNEFQRVAYGTSAVATHTVMVFRLSKKAVDAGLPDWNSLVYPHRKLLQLGDLPHVVPFVVDDPEVEGGKYMGLRVKDCAVMAKDGAALSLESDPADFWSHGKMPEAGLDYAMYGDLTLTGNENPYVFPGDSMTMRASAMKFEADMNDVTFNDLTAVGGATFIPGLMQDPHFFLRGKLKLMAQGEYDGPAMVKICNGAGFTLESDISGENDLRIYLMREGGGGLFSILRGTVHLSGDNSDWSGKLLVSATNDVYQLSRDKGECAVSALSNLTLRVSDSLSLGGAMPAFTYDALTVSNQCRLAVDGTTTFSETTRGWYFPRTGYLYVTNDAVATCKNVITLGGELVKEGAGTLCLDAPLAEEAGRTASVFVQEGVLAAGTSDAFSGVGISFASGTSLGLNMASGDAVFAEKGLDLTGADISSADDVLRVSVLGLDEELGAGCGPYALFTCSSEDADSVLGSYGVLDPWQGRGVGKTFTVKDNGDGTVTVSVTFRPCGLRLVIR